MGGAAVIGMVLSAFGVFLVWTTFNATREANVIASDANRPWLDLVVTEKREFYIRPSVARVAIFVSITNRGKSPAICVRPRAVLIAFPEIGSDHHGAIDLLNKELDQWEATNPKSWNTIFPEVKQENVRLGYNIFREKLDAAVGGPGKKGRFWVAVGVSYKSGNKWCRTSHAYMVTYPRRPQTRDVSEFIDLKPDEFDLAPMGQDYAT